MSDQLSLNHSNRKMRNSATIDLVPVFFAENADDAERAKSALSEIGIEAVVELESARVGIELKNPILLVAEADFEEAERRLQSSALPVAGDWDEDDDAVDDDDDDDDEDEDFLPDDDDDDYDDDDDEGDDDFDDE